MKKKILLGIFSFLLMIVTFAGCALQGGPSANDAVFGNGGLAVQKGEWLYFAGGYESYTTLEAGHKNQTGKVEVGALYRTKLNLDGTVAVDEDGYPTNYQRVASKLVGYEYGSLYIFGEQIYFSSPNTNKDKTGAYHFDQISFYQINLNGTGLTELYATTNYSSSSKYMFSKVDGRVVLTVLDGKELIKVDAGNKNKTVLAEDVSAAQMISQRDYHENASIPALKDFVFFTRPRTAVEGAGVTGNILEKVNLKTNERTVLKNNADTTYTLQGMTYSRVFYAMNNNLIANYIFSSAFDSQNGEQQHTVISDISNFVAFRDAENGALNGFVFVKNAKLYYQPFNDKFGHIELLSSSPTVLMANNGKVYYKHSTGAVAAVNVSNLETNVLTNSTGTTKIDNANQVDFGLNTIYFLNQPTNSSNYYLHQVSLSASEDLGAQLLIKPISSDISKD